MIDIMLAGDNAVVIGMAAARVPPGLRSKVILWGLAAAVALRVGAGADRGVADAGDRPDPGGRHSAVMGVLALLARHFRPAQAHAALPVDAGASLRRAIAADRARRCFHVAGQCAGGGGRGASVIWMCW